MTPTGCVSDRRKEGKGSGGLATGAEQSGRGFVASSSALAASPGSPGSWGARHPSSAPPAKEQRPSACYRWHHFPERRSGTKPTSEGAGETSFRGDVVRPPQRVGLVSPWVVPLALLYPSHLRDPSSHLLAAGPRASGFLRFQTQHGARSRQHRARTQFTTHAAVARQAGTWPRAGLRTQLLSAPAPAHCQQVAQCGSVFSRRVMVTDAELPQNLG